MWLSITKKQTMTLFEKYQVYNDNDKEQELFHITN